MAREWRYPFFVPRKERRSIVGGCVRVHWSRGSHEEGSPPRVMLLTSKCLLPYGCWGQDGILDTIPVASSVKRLRSLTGAARIECVTTLRASGRGPRALAEVVNPGIPSHWEVLRIDHLMYLQRYRLFNVAGPLPSMEICSDFVSSHRNSGSWLMAGNNKFRAPITKLLLDSPFQERLFGTSKLNFLGDSEYLSGNTDISASEGVNGESVSF